MEPNRKDLLVDCGPQRPAASLCLESSSCGQIAEAGPKQRLRTQPVKGPVPMGCRYLIRAVLCSAAVAYVVMATSFFAAHGAFAAEADAEAGSQVFGRCVSCHSTEPGENGIGPSLAGIVGQTSGSVDGFNYSTAMKEADIVWDDETLDKYLQNPARFMRGTKMFVGLPNDRDRANVIAYLKTLSP